MADKIFYGSAPVLIVNDLMKSLDFYCDILGFDRPHLWGDPPAFAIPFWEDMSVMLSLAQPGDLIKPKGRIWDVYFWVHDAQGLYESLLKKGAQIENKPFVTGYNNLEFNVIDPDGYMLTFGQELED